MTQHDQTPVQSGERAPDFVVPAVHEDRTISLADYRGKTPLLLGLFPGMYCPFCRRALAQMATTSEQLKSLGVDSLAIVGTELENARLYFKFRPTRMALGADPQLTTHRSYGVPRPEPTPELDADGGRAPTSTRLESFRRRCRYPPPAPRSPRWTAISPHRPISATGESTFTQMKGQFLIDRDGIVRWANIECGKEGLSGVGKFPSHDELIDRREHRHSRRHGRARFLAKRHTSASPVSAQTNFASAR